MVKTDTWASTEELAVPLLQVHDLSFSYGQKMLFHQLSLSIQGGEMVGLLGPNGSGKTTLLRLLSGVLQSQQGQILLEGRNLRGWGRRRVARRIAQVPQELHMPFAFTVEHMVSLGRTPFVKPFLGARTQHDQRVVEEAIEATGITSLAGHIFNELSGGERQRVMIAMALAQQPAVLLLDEPTSHLDIKYQIETLELVQRLNSARGVTVVAAMHDLNLAARYFPRLLLFQHGVVADASPAEVLEPGLLSRVYGVNVRVGILRGAEHLSILPPDSREKFDKQEERPQPLVHVMAGGGSGALLMRALADEHIPFAAGALNIGDSDHTLALRLATDVITEQPYAPISPATLKQVRDSLTRIRMLILCPTPFGPGNLPLLQEVVHFAQNGLVVVLLTASEIETMRPDSETMKQSDDTDMLTRDYTGGEATRLMKHLLQAGAIVAGSVGEVIEVVRNRAL
ncbi:MAG: ABC transporter ATP-binding protein [Chloroflexi bacterium]|nr:ABC transporter ATP-binding protein [Chloroflexota bacterium]